MTSTRNRPEYLTGRLLRSGSLPEILVKKAFFAFLKTFLWQQLEMASNLCRSQTLQPGRVQDAAGLCRRHSTTRRPPPSPSPLRASPPTLGLHTDFNCPCLNYRNDGILVNL